jgi:hypothetical protein
MKISSWKNEREIMHLGFLGIYGDDIKMESQEIKHDDERWLQMAQDSKPFRNHCIIRKPIFHSLTPVSLRCLPPHFP